jgi:hypothetical protein
MNERIAKVLSKFVRRNPMSAAALTSTTRSALGLLVEKEQRRTGSRMTAYDNIAKIIGTSPSWIRKFLAESQEVKEPRLTLFQNIRASYEKLCNRVEQENRDDERRLMLIKGEMNAVVEGFGAEASPKGQDYVRAASEVDPPQ